MVRQQILVAAKLLSPIASLVIALGPMASVVKCCCFAERVRQWIGSTSQFDLYKAPSLAGSPIAAEPVDPRAGRGKMLPDARSEDSNDRPAVWGFGARIVG